MTSVEEIRQITPQDLANLGVDNIAYVRVTEIDGQFGYAIHAADGARLAVLPSRNNALAVIINQGMQPVSVH